MNLGARLQSFGVKSFDDLIKDRVAGLVAVYFDK